MRLLLDQGLPRGATSLLARAHIDAIHVGDAGLSQADDSVILTYARRTHRVVVTLDSDFHSIMVRSGAHKPSVIRIRIEGLRAEALARLVVKVLHRFRADLLAGAMVSVDAARARVRRFPVK